MDLNRLYDAFWLSIIGLATVLSVAFIIFAIVQIVIALAPWSVVALGCFAAVVAVVYALLGAAYKKEEI